MIAKFFHYDLQEVFIVRRTGLAVDAQPGTDHVCDAGSVLLAQFGRDIEATQQECFNQFNFLDGESRGLVENKVALLFCVEDGRLQLGTWQGIFLLEHRASPHRRALVLTLIGKESR